MTVQFALESVSSLPWNHCPVCCGIAVQFAVEYTNTTASAFVSSVSHHFHAGGDNLEAGYTGGETRAGLKNRDIDWQVATKRSKLKAVPRESKLGALLSRLESVKASIRSKVEHPFHIVKNLFSHRKVRYKGLKKNTAQWHILFALANLVIAKRELLALHSHGTS